MRFEQSARALGLICAVAAAACTGGSESETANEVQANDVRAQALHRPDQLARWFEQSSPAVLALGGTAAVQHDQANNRLVFGVEHAAAIAGVRNALAHLGIPESAFAVQVTEPIYQLATLRDRFRPTLAGVQ